jgi:hypothetical protein
MRYETERNYRGSEEAVLAAVEQTLEPNGFRLVESGAGRHAWAGRGMRSSKENPLRGATEIHLRCSGGVLRLHAALGGVRRMAIFVIIFPIVLWSGLTLAPMIASGGDRMSIGWTGMIGVGLWLIVGPLLAWSFRRRTVQALDDLLENAAAHAARDAR